MQRKRPGIIFSFQGRNKKPIFCSAETFFAAVVRVDFCSVENNGLIVLIGGGQQKSGVLKSEFVDTRRSPTHFIHPVLDLIRTRT